MRVLLTAMTLICFFNCFSISSFSQDRVPPNLSLKIGAGNNISAQHFFTTETSLNIPSTSFVNVGLTTNLLQRNSNSLFIGVEMQAVNYYPTINEKTNLGFVSLLVGKTKRFDLSGQIYLKQTNGLSLNSLIDATSSNINNNAYSGNPFKNMNLGAFSNLQVLFAGEKRKNRNINYGIGIDIACKGFQIFKDRTYPSYLTKNYFIQYGLNFNMNYNF
ncbi:MAG: hypothetical protein WKG06_31365 [Segetibacter sp.]